MHAVRLSARGAPSPPSDARPSPAGAPWGGARPHAAPPPSPAPRRSSMLPSGSVQEINSSARLNGTSTFFSPKRISAPLSGAALTHEGGHGGQGRWSWGASPQSRAPGPQGPRRASRHPERSENRARLERSPRVRDGTDGPVFRGALPEQRGGFLDHLPLAAPGSQFAPSPSPPPTPPHASPFTGSAYCSSSSDPH